MSESNLSCVLYGPGNVRYENRPTPKIEDKHDALIRIAYVGVCGSDVHFWAHGGVSRMVTEDEPIVMGHEASGIVHSIGSGVTHLKVGDRVAIEPGFNCRRCKQCKAGRYNICPQMHFAADPPGNHGTLSRLFKIPADFVYPIPDLLSLQEAVLVEPLAVAVHSVRLAKLVPGQSVLVQGSGAIGLLTAAVAKTYGARTVIVSDVKEEKLKFAGNYITRCTPFQVDLRSTPQQESQRLMALPNVQDGVDVAFECSGVESSAQTGLLALAPGGTFVQVGLGKPDQTLPLLAMCEKEVTLKTAFRYGPGDYEIALSLLGTGNVTVIPLISSIVPFKKAHVAWEKTKQGKGIKNLIQGIADEPSSDTD
ncbi:unnamed protein product [Clonostachys rosea]|uniref:D-xylulose reductase n=1 Tax=Bionectria ochroleuca TaxID=29856 RepID=A0ABY6ULV9_BIOOC|nr:unnamed protein product [Clonostachys rosea]